jgi:hypothetical protein
MMNKRIKQLLKTLKELYESHIIKKIALKTKFIKRKSKLTPEIFLSFCLFGGEDLCRSSLLQLSARLRAKEDISISPQALDKRFSKQAVEFIRSIFQEMLKMQNKVLNNNEHLLKSHFKAIKIADSTVLPLPKHLKSTYRGCGGSSAEAAAKIQLEYELFTGSFTQCEIFEGVSSDMDYLPTLEKGIEEKELHLKDLGYFKVEHLKFIESFKAYYISKLKSTTTIYVKNENPEIMSNGKVKKTSLYKKVDIEEIVKPLAEGETIEILDIYIGKINKIKTRLIVTKLTKECKAKREEKFKKDVKKKKKKATDKSDFWNSINIYMTNISTETLSKEHIHDIYSLRWQVELMFKIWKSLFKIHDIKKVKLERFQCFLYGQLTALLLSSTIVYTSKKIISEENKKEISEIKSFGIVKEFFSEIKENIFKSELSLMRFLNKIMSFILRYGIKSKRKQRKTPFIILNRIKIHECELVNLAQ